MALRHCAQATDIRPVVEEEERGEIESEVMVQTHLTKSERQASTKGGSLESDGLHRSGKLSMRFGFALSKAMRNAMLEASRVAAAHRADSFFFFAFVVLCVCHGQRSGALCPTR